MNRGGKKGNQPRPGGRKGCHQQVNSGRQKTRKRLVVSVYSWQFWWLHNWEGRFLITVIDIRDLTKALSGAEGDSILTMFSRHLLAQAPVKQHFTRSL